MGKTKVLIVDDSTFSIAVLKRMLDENTIEVVGVAQTVAEGIEKARELSPDLITMDMTLPDGTGLDCAETILKTNPDIKIIGVSAMMDDELIEQVKKIGLRGYLQKPVVQESLDALLKQIFEGDMLFESLRANFGDAFKESLFSFLKREIGGNIEVTKIEDRMMTAYSEGISSTVGIIGRHDGRLIIDMPEDLAILMTRKILQDDSQTINDAIMFMGEFANMIGGNACSLLNGANRSFGLRLSPPTIFRGTDILISIGDLIGESFVAKTDFGNVFMDIGFQKGVARWM